MVVVTGGASGIGAALCRRFATDGARHVAVVDLDGEGARRVAAEVGGSAHTLDVRSGAAVAAMIDDVETTAGPIGLYCSNAGIVEVGGVDTSPEAWQRSWEVNVLAHQHAGRVLVPRWIERGGGHLLITASAAGLLTQLGSLSYSVSKHAAVAFGEWVAITHGDDGVGVSILCPQAVRTPLVGSVEGQVVAVDGMVEPEEVASAVARGLADDALLILPHPEVAEYLRRKGSDPARWVAGMRRLWARTRPGR